MTTELAPEQIKSTGTLTIEDLDIIAATGNAAFLDFVSDLAADTSIIFQSTYVGDDSLSFATTYAVTVVKIVDNTDGTEDGSYTILTSQDGAVVDNVVFAKGLAMNGATGGDQGLGSINATALFVNGVAADGAGDMLLATIQNVTAEKNYDVNTLKINGLTSGSIFLNATAVAGTGTLTFPVATDTLAVLALSQAFTNKTMDNTNTVDIDALADIANLRVVGNTSGGAAAPSEITIFDEDNMVSDSATALATQQSIKAFVESQSHQAGAFSLQLYTDPADFIAGVTIALTLPIASAGDAEANVSVYFNGLWQQSDQWTISGTTITFSAIIPVGITDIEIRVFTVS